MIVALLLAGCEAQKQPWETALETRTCTAEEMTRVQSETLFCTTKTGYFSDYCYGTAILRNCPTPMPGASK